MEAEGLQHGKYDVYHRLDADGATLFSVASMVEPGTFDPLRMAGESFPGITLFTQLPGAVESMLAFNEMVQTSRRLQEQLGGTLQDERGVPLTIHRLERLRQDIRDFDQGHARETGHRAETAPSAAP
jgi:cell division protein ZipA